MSLRVIDWSVFLEAGSAGGGKSAMTVGVFDGVHLGHRALIEKIVRRGPNPTVITFRENPKRIVSPDGYKGDIFSLKQKLEAFERLGVERVVLIDFSEKFSRLSGWEFIDLLEDRGKMDFLALGSNFRCGFGQETGADLIAEMNGRKGIATELLPPVSSGNKPVSSSRVRAAIISGDMKQAAALLGRRVELDLSDITPLPESKKSREGIVYDFRVPRRIVPETGQYTVLLRPGGVLCRAETEGGKFFLPLARSCSAGSVEFVET